MKGLWSCYLRMAFRDGDNFCKAFEGATSDMTNSLVLLQKLCKNCPHPKKLQLLNPFYRKPGMFPDNFCHDIIAAPHGRLKLVGSVFIEAL